MDSRKIALHETAVILIGQLICIPLMIGIFALTGYYDSTVLWGGIMGGVIATANFFIMALVTGLASDKAEKQDIKGGQALVQQSYMIRMILLLVALVVCGKSGIMHPLALVLPLVFVRPTLTVAEFFRKKGDK